MTPKIYGEFEISMSSDSRLSFLLETSSGGGGGIGSFGFSKPEMNIERSIDIKNPCVDRFLIINLKSRYL